MSTSDRTRALAAAGALTLCVTVAVGAAAPSGATLVVALAASEHAAYQAALASATAAVTAAIPGARVVAITLGDDEEQSLEAIRGASPSLVMTIGSRAARLVRRADPGMPIVYAMVLDPSSLGLPAPGQNGTSEATGIAMDVPLEDQFALIRSILPSARRIGVIYDPSISGDAVRKAEVVARSMGLKLVAQAVRSSSAVLEGAGLLAPSVDAMLAIADPTVLTPANTRPLILFWLRARKPLFATSEGFVRNGAIAALVTDPAGSGRRAGEMAARILLGASPSRVAPEPPPVVSIYVNKASAEHLGISLPPDVIARAREVIADR